MRRAEEPRVTEHTEWLARVVGAPHAYPRWGSVCRRDGTAEPVSLCMGTESMTNIQQPELSTLLR